MELPIDHFRLLGVNASSDRQSVLRTLQHRLDRVPDQGFTQDTLQARGELLEASADLLSDETRRQAYERELTAIADNANGSIAALEIPPSREVGGLLLLMEAGQSQEAFDSASRGLQPPQAPALGSSREADLTLLAGLACQSTARDYRDQRRYEAAALTLQQGLQLLQRMGQQAEQRRKLEQDLKELLPYRVLDLISRDLSASSSRQQGIALLEQLVQQRGGLEGHTDLTFPQSEFQSFFKQIRQFLTAQEQVELFSRWGDRGSATADFLASFALTASGFSQRKPERILEAYERLKISGQPGIEVFLSCQQLLLGQVDEAERFFDEGADAALKQWAMEQGDDPLARLCAYCRDWLTREVLEGFRDIDVDANLDAWFADRDVQAYIDQQDRIRGRQFNAKPSFEVPAATDTSTGFGDWPNFDLPGSNEPPTSLEISEDQEDDDEVWDGSRGRLAELLGNLQEQIQELPSWGMPVGAAVAIGVIGLGGLMALKPRGGDPEAASSEKVAALVQPKAAAPAAPVQAAPFPLTNPDPSATQLQDLLEVWLKEKAAVLAGGAPSESLSDLARPNQIQRLQRQSQANRQRDATETVTTSITGFKISARSPVRIAAQVAMTYSDELKTSGGKILSRTPEITLRNTYIFGRQNGSWQLVAYTPTAKN